MIVTKEKLEVARTAKGGYSKAQVDRGQKLTNSKRWYKKLIGMSIEDKQWMMFVNSGRSKRLKAKKVEKILNAMSKGDDWAWKPDDEDIPAVKIKSKNNKNKGKNKAKRNKVSAEDDKKFYRSKEWRELRVRVLEKYECKCMMCGESPKVHSIVIHCDHIKPRSKYRELSLDFNNLQLLCEACKLGKSNKYETDWRPELNKNN